MYCSKCGQQVHDEAEICVHCGCSIKNSPEMNAESNKIVRFLLTFFLGFIGSLIINHTTLKPAGWKSRTCAYFFLGLITFGIYELVASIANVTFDPAKASNLGYFRTEGEMYVSETK